MEIRPAFEEDSGGEEGEGGVEGGHVVEGRGQGGEQEDQKQDVHDCAAGFIVQIPVPLVQLLKLALPHGGAVFEKLVCPDDGGGDPGEAAEENDAAHDLGKLGHDPRVAACLSDDDHVGKHQRRHAPEAPHPPAEPAGIGQIRRAFHIPFPPFHNFP